MNQPIERAGPFFGLGLSPSIRGCSLISMEANETRREDDLTELLLLEDDVCEEDDKDDVDEDTVIVFGSKR